MRKKNCVILLLSIVILLAACATTAIPHETDIDTEKQIESKTPTKSLPTKSPTIDDVKVTTLPATYSPTSSGPQLWEYTIVRKSDRAESIVEANRLGAEGWELVAVAGAGGIDMYFKRPLS